MNEAYSRLKLLLADQDPLLGALQVLSTEKQVRLHDLMDLHSEGQLDPNLLRELTTLVDEANKLELVNLHRLVEHQKRLSG